ncbi:MAG: Ppx/GppA family phosphatase [Gammaproteobacteria bacterium]|nr:Ppx/GppA family phosphatase [Gammaproteobacteria bacterium]
MSLKTAIVDLGSNTTRLVIYEYEPGKWFHLTDGVREVVRLREGMGQSNVLRSGAIDRSLNALRMFRALCDALGVTDVKVVATSAVRDAENSASFLSRAESDTGWQLRILSGEEEGYYGALGGINATGLQQGFVVDMGGGSVQVTKVHSGTPVRSVSMPLGALRLTELFLGSDSVSERRTVKLRQYVRDQLAPLDWFHARPGDELVIIGGTIRNLARIDKAGKGYPLTTVHGYQFPAEDLRSLSDELWRLPLKKRRTRSGLNQDRADIIHTGALTYNEILSHSGFSWARISSHGLREGVFYKRFLAEKPRPIIDELRRFSVFSLAQTFEGNEIHSQHVAHLSLRMFDDLQAAHQIHLSYRELLWAAGILHDIGATISHDYHHQHSSYIVLNNTLPGYSPRELAFISLLCRYHRNKGKPKLGKFSPLMTGSDKQAIRVLSGVL